MLSVALAFGAWGCAKEEAKTDEAKDKTASAEVKAAAQKKEPKVSDREIPTPEDFEAQAERDITEANFEEELEKIEKQVESE
jgi:hypothetical protein